MAMPRFRSVKFGVAALLGAGALGLLATGLGTGPVRGQKDAKMVERWIKDGAPGIVELGRPERVTGKLVTMEITVRPVTVVPGEGLLLRVDLVNTAEFKTLGAKAATVASGTVGFYPPAANGVERTFVVPVSVADDQSGLGEPLTAVVSLVAGNAERKLAPASIEVVNARLL